MICLNHVNPEVLTIVKNALLPYFPDLTQSILVDALLTYDDGDATDSVKTNYYTLKEAAKKLDCTLPTIYAWEKRGKLSIKKIGSKSYISKSDIQKIISG